MDVNLILIMFCVLSLGAASGYFSERVGIVNIGINGMMVFGAMMYTIFGALLNGNWIDSIDPKGGQLGHGTFIIAMILAALSTSIMGLFFGFSTIYLKTDHVIAGTSINLLGGGIGLLLTNTISHDLFGSSINELTNAFKYDWNTGSTLWGTVLFLFLFVLAILITFMVVFKTTKFGLRYKSIGENPNAADSQGINVTKYQWIGIMISSILAGLGGAAFMYRTGGVVPFGGDVDGLGFMALAIMITGSWRLPLITIVSILFAVLYTFGNSNVQGVDNNIIKMTPYIVTIIFLILFSKNMRGPKFAGNHFDKSRR